MPLEKVNDTTYRKKYADCECEVGDSKDSEFQPQIKVMRWGNDANISFRLAGVNRAHREDDGKVKSGTGDVEIEFSYSGNGVVPKITITKKTNKLEFTLEDKNAVYVRQKKWTDKDGNLLEYLTEGQTYFADGVETVAKMGDHFRAAEYHGAYRVKHASKRNNQFKSGTLFYFTRPTLTDANGESQLLDIDIKNNKLTFDLNGVGGPLPWVVE